MNLNASPKAVPKAWAFNHFLYAFVCTLSVFLAFVLYQKMRTYMDIYERVILCCMPLLVAYVAFYFKALRWYLPLVWSFGSIGVWAYAGQLARADKAFLLKYFLSSQVAILWMSVCIGFATLAYVFAFLAQKPLLQKMAYKSAWLALIFGGLGMLMRWHESYLIGTDVGHIPISNLYEVFVLFILFGMMFFMYFLQKYPQSGHLGAFFMPLMALSNGFILWYATARQAHQIQALVPALQSWWMKIHVPANFVGYATFSFAALIGAAYLVKVHKTHGRLQKLLPSSLILEEMMYQAIAIGFAFFTLATILGAFWAAEAWGGYWSWDPKEVWALVVWLNYAAWLHARLISAWQPRVLAWWAIIGLLLTSFAFMGVNMFLSGLHAYGEL